MYYNITNSQSNVSTTPFDTDSSVSSLSNIYEEVSNSDTEVIRHQHALKSAITLSPNDITTVAQLNMINQQNNNNIGIDDVSTFSNNSRYVYNSDTLMNGIKLHVIIKNTMTLASTADFNVSSVTKICLNSTQY